MSIHEGVVSLTEDDIPVIVELNDGTIRLTASGTEIGYWPKDECEIHHRLDGTYAISVENETLSFIPDQPTLFAAAVDGSSPNGQAQETKPAPPDAGPAGDNTRAAREAPPPGSLTKGLFYALCALTAALAIWSMVSILS